MDRVIGMRVFVRAASVGSLTACQRILPEIDEAEAAATSQRIGATVLLRMNVPQSFVNRYVAADTTGYTA